MTVRTVAVVGAGTMGHALAQLFAQGGYKVWLNDLEEARLVTAMRMIASNLTTQVESGILRDEEPAAILRRVRPTVDLQEAGHTADLVLETITEDVEAKRALFAELERVTRREAILASNTSYIDIFSEIRSRRPESVVITHWFAPPHIVPLVEVVPGARTSEATVATVKAVLIGLGKLPMVLSEFLPGFVVNRLQAALRNEALFLLENGYVTAEGLDTAVKGTLGLRMPILGVARRMDFAGLDFTQRVLRNRPYVPPPVRRDSRMVDALVAQGHLGVKSGRGFYDYKGRSSEAIMRERDVKLMELCRLMRELGELPKMPGPAQDGEAVPPREGRQ